MNKINKESSTNRTANGKEVDSSDWLYFLYYPQQFRQLVSRCFYSFRGFCAWYTWLACFFVFTHAFNPCFAESFTFTRPNESPKLSILNTEQDIIFNVHFKDKIKGMVFGPSKFVNHVAKMFNKFKFGNISLATSGKAISNDYADNRSEDSKTTSCNDVKEFFHYFKYMCIGFILSIAIVVLLSVFFHWFLFKYNSLLLCDNAR